MHADVIPPPMSVLYHLCPPVVCLPLLITVASPSFHTCAQSSYVLAFTKSTASKNCFHIFGSPAAAVESRLHSHGFGAIPFGLLLAYVGVHAIVKQAYSGSRGDGKGIAVQPLHSNSNSMPRLGSVVLATL